MSTFQEQAIESLLKLRGDDTAQCKATFAGLSGREMRAPFRNGKSRQDILEAYIGRDKLIEQAIQAIRKIPTV